ncbi:PAS domain-containing protein [Pararhizobium sp. BT-229]|uniref:helix-turn-helix transcriptional regulator n=1 Tax=Pararhizobium sp. BT-229 TaxID=2986923 RepID=UPI0021F6E8F9|nr:PAS domain-containing protein [Pararhizobium sp. BT-229]MCV9962046.1 PAS domain-containing protein [Pararhizobium sp. BT-229]
MPHPLTPFVPVCEAIATLFSPHVEAVLHDLDSGLIFHIANAFSKRRAGDSSLNEAGLVSSLEGDVIGPYGKSNWDGRRLKAITSVLRDADGKPIGLLCINHDIEAFAGILDQLKSTVDIAAPMPKASALMAEDWREAVNAVIGDFLATRRATLAGLTSTETDDLIGLLDARGVFAIRKAVPYVAEILKLSRATIYNRLGSTRQKQETTSQGEPR